MNRRRGLLAGVLIVVVLVLSATPALAHSFLIDTRPGQGERLTRSPSEVVFQFTEAVVRDTTQVELTDGDGGPVATGGVDFESDGRVLRVRLAEQVEGVVVVSWHVVSAVDGHESAGELAFAVGESGRLPTTSGSQATDTREMVWRWVLVGGLSLGLGALVASSTGQISAGRAVAWGRLGLAVAALGPTVVYLQSITGGLSEGTIAAGAAGLLFALGALAVGGMRSGLATPALVVAGIVIWASRSHATTANGALGTIADAAHLAGAAFWFGTLTLLVVDLWRAHRQGVTLLEAARRYSRWALRAVIVLAVAGVISAFSLLTTISDLWSTGYGRLLLTKTFLFGSALALAALSRWRALNNDNLGLLRRFTTIEVILVSAIVASSGLLAITPPPALATTGETLLGPPPLSGPVARAAGLAGNMTVGVAAGERRLDLLVYNQSTGGIDGAEIEASAILPDGTGLDLHPRPCGAGCFTQQLDLPTGVTTITVTAESEEWTNGTVNLDLDWPPRDRQPLLLDEVITAMRAVDQLALTETVNSGPGAEATSTATISGDAFIDLEVYANADLEQVTPLPDSDGIRLYLPGSRILVDLHLDDQHRIKRERIVSPGHEITRTITYP